MAKTIEDLTESRAERDKLLQYFNGELPTSLMQMKGDKCSQDGTRTQNSISKMPESKAFRMSGVTVRGVEGGLSRFPQNVGRAILLFYTKEFDLVLDPFAGHNSRMELCWRACRHYRGNDISAAFQAHNAEVLKQLRAEKASDFFGSQMGSEVELTVGDSRRLPWDSGIGDFTITSPPYYNVEYYGNEPEQLGNAARSYWDFLDRLLKVCKENFRVLKPGAFAAWFVNDFRVDGRFYNYHGDLIRLMEKSGFNQHDICVVDLGPGVRSAFAAQAFEQKILPKRHEYGLIFRKPK